MICLPEELEPVRERARVAMKSFRPATGNTSAPKDFVFSACILAESRDLPPYFLIYFLLVELLGFEDIGKYEKVSWSIPIDANGRVLLVEHRKFGVVIAGLEGQEADASDLAACLSRAAKAARPFFDWKAQRAVDASSVNVVNHSGRLFERYVFFRDTYRSKAQEATARKDDFVQTPTKYGCSITFPGRRLAVEADWLALAAIDSFFSWTEHIFIHLSILTGATVTAEAVAELAVKDWGEKYKKALDLTEPATKSHFDKLTNIRRQLRNFIAHGSFGKEGEAFHFHSNAGAVPVLLPHRASKESYRLGERLEFVETEAIDTLEAFIVHLWSGLRAPAKLYIQESYQPLILTMALDGTYRGAMQSEQEMSDFLDWLGDQSDRAANMDW